MEFGFVGPAYLGRSTAIESEKCINWYLEVSGPNAKSRMALIPTPGMISFTHLVGAARGMYTLNDTLYVVAAGGMYAVDTDGVVTLLGTLDTTSGRVSFADNGVQIMVVDGTSGYTYTLATTTFAKITHAGFPANPEHVTFIDGFFLVNIADSGKFYKSGLYDGTTWNALWFATAESSSDNVVNIKEFNDEVWLFGEFTIEPWYNNGAGDFPYAQRGNAVIDAGTVAPWSVAEMDNSLFWLGQSKRGEKVIFRTEGYQKRRISTHAIEFAFDTYSDISDAFGFTYIEEGHSFYALTFPTAGVTWVYDASIPDPAMAWHQRSSNGDGGRWLVDSYAYFNGDHYVSEYNDIHIFRMSHSAFDENGSAIRRVRTSPHVHIDRERVFINTLEIVFKAGVGLQMGQGSDPQAMIRISRDGGKTWGSEIWRSIGKVGEYLRRVRVQKIGMSYDFVFELTVTDPIDAEIVSATLK